MRWLSKREEGEKKTSADDDAAYVAACRKGDPEAFAVLVRRHSSKMLTVACRLLGDYDEACDVTQEAFLAAYRSLGSFRADAAFSTWLYRIVVNCAKNRLKKIRILSGRESGPPDEAEGGGCAGLACSAFSDAKDPERALEEREINAQVEKCLAALEEDQREVLVLRDVRGFSYGEIREVLKIPEGTVKSRLARARLAMKDCLKKAMGTL